MIYGASTCNIRYPLMEEVSMKLKLSGLANRFQCSSGISLFFFVLCHYLLNEIFEIKVKYVSKLGKKKFGPSHLIALVSRIFSFQFIELLSKVPIGQENRNFFSFIFHNISIRHENSIRLKIFAWKKIFPPYFHKAWYIVLKPWLMRSTF